MVRRCCYSMRGATALLIYKRGPSSIRVFQGQGRVLNSADDALRVANSALEIRPKDQAMQRYAKATVAAVTESQSATTDSAKQVALDRARDNARKAKQLVASGGCQCVIA